MSDFIDRYSDNDFVWSPSSPILIIFLLFFVVMNLRR